MNCIQNSCIGISTPFKKAIAGSTCVLAITVIALSVIGLTAMPSAPFNAIAQLGTTTNGILLGTSILVLMLDLGSAALCRTTLVAANKEINDTDLVSQLPEEIIFKIFGYLSAIELAKCDRVCKTWRRLASDETLLKAFDLRNLSPLLRVFDESDWDKHVDMSAYGLTTKDIPPLDKRKEITLLKRVLSLPAMEEIEGNAGVTKLIIPKGLTANKLVELALSPKMGNITQFRSFLRFFSAELGDIPVVETYQIVITNNVLLESRNLSLTAQKKLLEKFGCEMSNMLEAATLAVVTNMSCGERFYNDDPCTFTRCSEQVAGYQLIAGDFSPDGVRVHDGCYFDHDGIGAGGILRKF